MGGIVLYSGGADSTALLHYTKAKHALFFYYGAKFNEPEYKRALFHTKKMGVKLYRVDISAVFPQSNCMFKGVEEVAKGDFTEDNKAFIVPNRNQIFINCAVPFVQSLGLSKIYVGLHKLPNKAQSFKDCTPTFQSKVADIISFVTNDEVSVSFPFKDWTKKDIMKYLYRHNIKYTYSCWAGDEEECLECPNCKLKYEI